MKTVTVTLQKFRFDELEGEAKEKALETFNEYVNEVIMRYSAEEALDTIKKGLAFFDFYPPDYCVDYTSVSASSVSITSNHPDLSYVRLWKYLHNHNYVYNLKEKDGTYKSCPFTGVCYDEDFLDPIRQFLKRPTNLTFEEIMEECSDSVIKSLVSEYEYYTNDEETQAKEYFDEEDQWFHENGELWKY